MRPTSAPIEGTGMEKAGLDPETVDDLREAVAEQPQQDQIPGLRPPTGGLQPIEDLEAFLASLPDLGSDADDLWMAIAEERSQRRAAVEKRKC